MTFKLTLEKNYGKDREEKRKLGRINCCICGLENSLNFQFLAAKDKLISEDTKKSIWRVIFKLQIFAWKICQITSIS